MDKIDTRVGKFFRVPQRLEIVAEIQPIHLVTRIVPTLALLVNAPLVNVQRSY